MDGMHDMGGRQGFGRIRFGPNAPVYHQDWERRVNALYSLAVRQGVFNMDEYRHAIERMEPRHYLAASYYERSLTGLATLCVEKGLFSKKELEQRAKGHFPLALTIGPGRVNAEDRERFQIGDKVMVRLEYVSGHVRAPGYVRGKMLMHMGSVQTMNQRTMLVFKRKRSGQTQQTQPRSMWESSKVI
jgi:nitrile hydratase